MVRRKLRLANTLFSIFPFADELFEEELPLLQRQPRPPRPAEQPPMPPQFRGRRRVRGLIRYVVYIRISDDDPRRMTGSIEYDGAAEDIWDAIVNKITEYFNVPVGITFLDNPEPVITLLTDDTLVALDYTNLRMRLEQPLDLEVNIFSNIIKIKQTTETCVPSTLRMKYPEISKQKKDPIKQLDNATTNDIVEFCKKYSIRMIAYNIYGNVISQHIPEKPSTKYSTLAYISYNNHMYPLKHKYLIEKPNKVNKEQFLEHENLQEFFISLLKQNIVPANIKTDGQDVTEFIHENIKYFYHSDSHRVQSVAKEFMFTDKVPYRASLSSLMTYIEPLYIGDPKQLNSFFPLNHQKPAFLYSVEPDKTRPTETIDMNKAYSHILQNLPFLLQTDIRTSPHEYTDKYTTEYALYIATPSTPNILMPRQDIYTGTHIKYLRKLNIPFTIQERLDCKHFPNHYKLIVKDLYNRVDETTAKQVINSTIGNFERTPKRKESYTAVPVNKENRAKRHSTHLTEDYYLDHSAQSYVSSLYNRKPIAIQVKDTMFRTLFEKMVELKKTDQDIIQINTDSITFYNDANKKYPYGTKPGTWKKGTYREALRATIYDSIQPFTTFQQQIDNNNTIITGPAGNGKSYHIQNNMDLTDAIILSSKHSAIRQHRLKGFNADVIQKFCYEDVGKNTIPPENHIIVEECGILTRQHWDFLFKCALHDKKLTLLGDFNQLLPVGEEHPFNSPLFINLMFKHQHRKHENWRNNFPLKYYNQLLTETPEFLLQELTKYSTKTPEEAEVIIVYRNTIKEKYNAYMLDYHKKKKLDADVPLICKTNDLRKHNIYNNFLVTRDELTLDDETIDKHFEPAYARTLYNLQGDEVKSFYVAPEDLHWFTNNRMAYTLISRLSSKTD